MIPQASLQPKKQYIISSPTGFQAAAGRYQSSLRKLSRTQDFEIIGDLSEDSEKLALMDDDDLKRIKTLMPGIVVEPNILYRQWRPPLVEDFEPLSLPFTGSAHTAEIRVSGESGVPLEGVAVYLIEHIAPGRKSGYEGVTGSDGTCRLAIAKPSEPFPLLVLYPRRDYWSRVMDRVDLRRGLDVTLQPLPPVSPEVYDWGHTYARMVDGAANGGQDVRIAIIDSGIRNDHPDLRPHGGINCVFNEDETRWHADEGGHGTHCAGIVAALINGVGLKGYAPGAQIYAYRVFTNDPAEGAQSYDILKAIDRAVSDGCDIISMSFGSSTPQTVIRSKIEFANDRGVLCLAATGNDGKMVSFPAAFPGVLGVAAFGKFGSYPKDSAHCCTESNRQSADGAYFLAKFSNFGDAVDFCAPGVAVRSTVPGGYNVLDGTSMACPQVAGVAALALASDPDLLNAPRDAERVERLISRLTESAETLGFGAQFEGAGFPRVDRFLRPSYQS